MAALVCNECIALIGMYLSHLIFIEEGNKDYIQGKPGMINFNKRQVVLMLKIYQNKLKRKGELNEH